MILSKKEIELVRKTGKTADKILRTAVESIESGVYTQDVASIIADSLIRAKVERILFIDSVAGSPERMD